MLNAERRTPDLIVSDFHLGGDDTGIQAIGEIRLLAGWSIPALLVTGDTSKRMVDAVELSGNCEVLSKPVEPLEFLERVNRLLQKPATRSAAN
jgi:CheY-like chemotaxis protein